MARRSSSGEGSSVSLFPFLSILACIIGALTLLIAALSMSQLQTGREPEDVARAEDFMQLEKKLKTEREDQAAARISLAPLLPKLEALKKPKEEIERLTLLLEKAKKEARDPVDVSALQTGFEENKLTLGEMDKHLSEGTQKLNGMKQELLSRRAPERGPTVMVKPSTKGSNRNYAFADLGEKEVVLFHQDKDETFPIGQMNKSPEFKKILDDLKSRNQTLVVLVRQSGAKNYPTLERILKSKELKFGKLPIVGEGEIDLSLFTL